MRKALLAGLLGLGLVACKRPEPPPADQPPQPQAGTPAGPV